MTPCPVKDVCPSLVSDAVIATFTNASVYLTAHSAPLWGASAGSQYGCLKERGQSPLLSVCQS